MTQCVRNASHSAVLQLFDRFQALLRHNAVAHLLAIKATMADHDLPRADNILKAFERDCEAQSIELKTVSIELRAAQQDIDAAYRIFKHISPVQRSAVCANAMLNHEALALYAQLQCLNDASHLWALKACVDLHA